MAINMAANYIAKRFLETGLSSFKSDFFQKFTLDANTFPENISAKTNTKKLQTGNDFLPSPACSAIKGKFKIIISIVFLFKIKKNS
jgi:hypothetical protein